MLQKARWLGLRRLYFVRAANFRTGAVSNGWRLAIAVHVMIALGSSFPDLELAMSNPTTPEAESSAVSYDEMVKAVGECILMWANVEFQLGSLANLYLGRDGTIASLIWGAIVSFDARLTMLQRILKKRFPNPPQSDDINLLLNHTRKLFRYRNEVAHSTLLHVEGKTHEIEPFFVLGDQKARLKLGDVQSRTNKFSRLNDAFIWLTRELIPQATLPPELAFSQPLDGLVRELRDEESQRRKEQQERDQLLKKFRELQEKGLFPQ